jgi:hypothetical protein
MVDSKNEAQAQGLQINIKQSMIESEKMQLGRFSTMVLLVSLLQKKKKYLIERRII